MIRTLALFAAAATGATSTPRTNRAGSPPWLVVCPDETRNP